MTTATSLILIAFGAILAFAVSFDLAGINIQTIGVILMVVGAIGLVIALATLAGYAPWGERRQSNAPTSAPPTITEPPSTP